jgi:hypothetical protein
MAAIQISIRGQGNVPDASVAEIRARVTALVKACTDAGAPENFLRVDFAPATNPVVEAPPAAPPQAPPPAPSAPVVPFEAAVLERPQPRVRAVIPHEPKVPVEKEAP